MQDCTWLRSISTIEHMFGSLVDDRMGWTPAQLDQEARELELAHRALEARRAANLIAAEARQVADVDGHRSTAAYLRATTNQPAAVAGALVRRARFCRDFPAAGEALRAGHVGVAQIDALARLAHHRRVGVLVTAELVAMFLEHAEHFSFRDFITLVDRWVLLADQDGAWRDHLDDVERRNASIHNVNGTLLGQIDGGDALTTERITRIFDRFVEAEFARDAADRRERYGADADAYPLARTDRQRRFDAWVRLCDTANAHADAPGRPVDVCANVLIDERTLHEALSQAGLMLPNGDVFDPGSDGWRAAQRDALLAELLDPQALLDRRCETVSGQPVHPRLVAQALVGGHVRRVVVDSGGEVVEVGSKQRLFTGKYAIAARILHPTCEHPGCELPAHLSDVDHRIPASHGGPTAPANSAVECNPHNRLKHSRQWRTVRARNRRLITIRPDGTLILPAGERPPPLASAA